MDRDSPSLDDLYGPGADDAADPPDEEDEEFDIDCKSCGKPLIVPK